MHFGLSAPVQLLLCAYWAQIMESKPITRTDSPATSTQNIISPTPPPPTRTIKGASRLIGRLQGASKNKAHVFSKRAVDPEPQCATIDMILHVMNPDPDQYPTFPHAAFFERVRHDFRVPNPEPPGFPAIQRAVAQRWWNRCSHCICDEQGVLRPNPAVPETGFQRRNWCVDQQIVDCCLAWFDCNCVMQPEETPTTASIRAAVSDDVMEQLKQQLDRIRSRQGRRRVTGQDRTGGGIRKPIPMVPPIAVHAYKQLAGDDEPYNLQGPEDGSWNWLASPYLEIGAYASYMLANYKYGGRKILSRRWDVVRSSLGIGAGGGETGRGPEPELSTGQCPAAHAPLPALLKCTTASAPSDIDAAGKLRPSSGGG
ncbi:hypothetical protein DRE_00108 [Drechslerella stenobrocha 248]|uniref:Uncharacterized protein n=1 Tax=Drechslerella stenobrocha 248 TaxID=1043628 RepID=W7I909_9PEZI|nr:hypothetical protein DRE_00108 [Drechslerella stenobrocha 248]